MQSEGIGVRDLVWALGSCCALHGKPFDAQLLLKQHAPPCSCATLITPARALGFSAHGLKLPLAELVHVPTPVARLLKAFEQWCKNRKVVEINLGINSLADMDSVGGFVRKMGYAKVGENFVKGAL